MPKTCMKSEPNRTSVCPREREGNGDNEEHGGVVADQPPSASARYLSPDPPQPTESALPIMVDLDKVVEKQ